MLELISVTAGYERGNPVVRNAGPTISPREAVGLLGPSGCGKSTLARVAALLHRPDSGRVVIDGEPARGWRHRAPREQRTAFGVVFQQPRLSADPRLRLADLIAEPLRACGLEPADRVGELAETVGLGADLLPRRPHEVSDGQLQRACLARALALRPRLADLRRDDGDARRVHDGGPGRRRGGLPRGDGRGAAGRGARPASP